MAEGLLELGRPVRLGQIQQPGLPPQCPAGQTAQLAMVGTNQVWQCVPLAGQPAPGGAAGGPQNLLACPLGGGYYDLQYTEGIVAGQSVVGRPVTESEIRELAWQENVQWGQPGCPSMLQAPAAAPPGAPSALPGQGALPPAGGGLPGQAILPQGGQAFLIVPQTALRRTAVPQEALTEEPELPSGEGTAGRLAAVGGLGAAILAGLALGGTLG